LDVLADAATLRYRMDGGSLDVATGGPGRAALDALVVDGAGHIRLANVAVTAVDADGVVVVSSGTGDTRVVATGSTVTLDSLAPSFRGFDMETPPSSTTAQLNADLNGNTVVGAGTADGVYAQARSAASSVCTNLQGNNASGGASSFTLGQTAGTFLFTGWNGTFNMSTNLTARTNVLTGAAPVQVGTVAAGVCLAASTVTPL
jgi:hypothetical protein